MFPVSFFGWCAADRAKTRKGYVSSRRDGGRASFHAGSKVRSSARQDVWVAKQILRCFHPEDEAQLVYRWLVLRTRHLLVDDPFARPAIEALAAALIEKQEMSGKEAKRVIGEALSELLRTRREHPKQ